MNRGWVATRFKVFEDGIEPFDVADLQNTIFLMRQLHQFRSLGGIFGHGFFDQDMPALREQGLGQFKMRGGGGDNIQRVAGRTGLGDGIEDAYFVFGGNFTGGVSLGVENTGELHLAGGG